MSDEMDVETDRNTRADAAVDAPRKAQGELTDAEVDAYLKEHENDPVDAESAERIEWLFRTKLAADALRNGKEWLRSYQEDVVEKGRRIAADTELLYGGTKLLIEKLVRVVETLALKPSTAATHALHSPPASPEGLLPCPFCGGRGIWMVSTDPPEPEYNQFIECDGCGTSTAYATSKAVAVAGWNARAPKEQTP
jgi:Lar family restriction alleviation protein